MKDIRGINMGQIPKSNPSEGVTAQGRTPSIPASSDSSGLLSIKIGRDAHVVQS